LSPLLHSQKSGVIPPAMIQDADYWIQRLELTPHPEGGYFRRIMCSPESFGAPPAPRFNGDRPFYSVIYYLLCSGQFSAIHRLNNDEIWHYCAGNSLVLFSLGEKTTPDKALLGPNPHSGQEILLQVPARTWFGAYPNQGDADYTLVTCFVSPAFDYRDFELGSAAELTETFPQHRETIRKYCIRP